MTRHESSGGAVRLAIFKNRSVATTPEVEVLIAADAPVAIGVSGGKDSSAVAIATVEYLDRVGHKGPRILIHSDLGLMEWQASLPMCQILADRLGLELVVVRREKGGMMERWEQRWADNVARYASLSCVQLILPWSTPDMRFCTSELKTDIICRALSRRYGGLTILSVTGIRRQESSGRAKAPIAKPEPKLTSVTRVTQGVTWNPIIEWSIDDVFGLLRERGMPLHEAYTVYGTSRVSCFNCIMASDADLVAANKCVANHAGSRRVIRLETISTFGFKGNRWLGDLVPDLLTLEERVNLRKAKDAAAYRATAEGNDLLGSPAA
ncbi:MAG: phosphoadenosine phosphosulfate reductase family protein [Tepidisphaeraceae bacterium]